MLLLVVGLLSLFVGLEIFVFSLGKEKQEIGICLAMLIILFGIWALYDNPVIRLIFLSIP